MLKRRAKAFVIYKSSSYFKARQGAIPCLINIMLQYNNAYRH